MTARLDFAKQLLEGSDSIKEIQSSDETKIEIFSQNSSAMVALQGQGQENWPELREG